MRHFSFWRINLPLSRVFFLEKSILISLFFGRYCIFVPTFYRWFSGKISCWQIIVLKLGSKNQQNWSYWPLNFFKTLEIILKKCGLMKPSCTRHIWNANDFFTNYLCNTDLVLMCQASKNLVLLCSLDQNRVGIRRQ